MAEKRQKAAACERHNAVLKLKQALHLSGLKGEI